MGLSGRKAKQRIGKDPRNLSWADGMNLVLDHPSDFRLQLFLKQMLVASDRPTLQNLDGMPPKVSVCPERDVRVRSR